MDGQRVFDNDRLLGRIFYVTEKNLYPEGFRIKNIFRWTKEFYPSFDMDYASTLCEKFGLNTDKKIKSLSTGYKSIFKAITALASGTDIIMFDEPVLGLDANNRDMFYKELLASYNRRPKTIIISTHLIEEVDEILEEVIIIKEGRVILTDSLEGLLSSAYTISGEGNRVNQYIGNRKYTGEETMGRYKSVIILEDTRDASLAQELGLEFGRVELQKLFIALTNY
jgi:ABC-2 type transport system ATP-binding protein